MAEPAPFPPSDMTLAKFSRKQTLDLQSAMAAAIGKLLREATFPGSRGKGTIALAKVYDDWPKSTDRALSPAACVRTPDPIRAAPALLTPTLLEETWEPPGRLGIGLYKIAEGESDFRIELRAATKLERSALVAGIATLFVEPMVLNDRGAGATYGRTLVLVDYWGLPVRVSRGDILTPDDEESAKTNRWDAEIVVSARADEVKVGVVSPFHVKIREQIT